MSSVPAAAPQCFMLAALLVLWSLDGAVVDAVPEHHLPADGHVVSKPHPNPCRVVHRPARCEVNATRASCSGGVHKVARPRGNVVRTLVLCHWPEDPFDPVKLIGFPALRRLQLTESNITELYDFPYNDHLEELILSGLRLTWLGDEAFSGLRRLRLLDLSRNQLSALDQRTLTGPPRLQHVLLAGNPWRCTVALAWMTEPSVLRLLLDADSLTCGAALYPRKPVIAVLTLLGRVARECPMSNCSCELTRVVRDARDGRRVRDVLGAQLQVQLGQLVPIITVNCSHRDLDTIPGRLPANTTTLLLRGNKIRSVRALVDKHPDVLDVYLDNNQVESIADLEGSHWLSNFRVLSLRANRLQQLPTYALDNALERNEHAVRVYLGLNPWQCDCLFMPTFQELLAKYKSLIADWDDIRCASVEGDDNSMKKVWLYRVLFESAGASPGTIMGTMRETKSHDAVVFPSSCPQIHSLSRSAVCREQLEPLMSPLDVVNASLGAALLLVLAKLAFDYWQYRQYGRLPWIATKLP